MSIAVFSCGTGSTLAGRSDTSRRNGCARGTVRGQRTGTRPSDLRSGLALVVRGSGLGLPGVSHGHGVARLSCIVIRIATVAGVAGEERVALERHARSRLGGLSSLLLRVGDGPVLAQVPQ